MTEPQNSGPTGTVSAAQDNVWSAARFRFEWPRDKPIAFHLDLLVGHCIVAPAVAAHRDGLALWRIHRRAARDAAGHQLTLWLHGPPAVANRVLDDVERHAMSKRLREGGLMTELALSRAGESSPPNIEDTSDRSWSPPMQRAWPFFIMGVSETWLALIDEYATRNDIDICKSPAPIAEVANQYAEVAATLRETWRDEGSHAFFHHLSAVFGYDPLLLRF